MVIGAPSVAVIVVVENDSHGGSCCVGADISSISTCFWWFYAKGVEGKRE